MTRKMRRVVAVQRALWLKGIFLSGGVTSGRMPIKGRTSSRKRTAGGSSRVGLIRTRCRVEVWADMACTVRRE